MKYLSQAQLGDRVPTNLNFSHFQGSIDDMKAEAETMIAAAKVEGEQIKRKGAEQVVSNPIFISSLCQSDINSCRLLTMSLVRRLSSLSN